VKTKKRPQYLKDIKNLHLTSKERILIAYMANRNETACHPFIQGAMVELLGIKYAIRLLDHNKLKMTPKGQSAIRVLRHKLTRKG